MQCTPSPAFTKLSIASTHQTSSLPILLSGHATSTMSLLDVQCVQYCTVPASMTVLLGLTAADKLQPTQKHRFCIRHTIILFYSNFLYPCLQSMNKTENMFRMRTPPSKSPLNPTF
jgi:hypothetical protein